MFVQTNTIRSIKEYFRLKLGSLYSENEIKSIYSESLCQRLGISKVDLITSDNQYLSESDLLFFRSIVKRLLNHEPFQYILGNTNFYGLEITCDKRALIPRPETEELVDWIVQHSKGKTELKILDLCTGTGCIALALKHVMPTSKVWGIDVAKGAIELANENAKKNELEVDFLKMDVLNSSSFSEHFIPESFQIWVSNPPYIPDSDKLKMSRNVLDFEPHLALFVSDHNPLLFYQQITKEAKVYLEKSGCLYFEIHEDLSQGVIELLEMNGFVNIELRKDLQGKPRMIKAQKF